MIRDRFNREDSGSSLVELVVVVAVLGLVFTAFYSSLFGFLRDTQFSEDLAQAERDTRPVIRQMVIELRQSEAEDTAAGWSTRPVARRELDRVLLGPVSGRWTGTPRVHPCELRQLALRAAAAGPRSSGELGRAELGLRHQRDAQSSSGRCSKGSSRRSGLFSGQRWNDVSKTFTQVNSCDRAAATGL